MSARATRARCPYQNASRDMPNTNDLCSMAGWVYVCVSKLNASAVKSIREKVVAANNHTNSSEENKYKISQNVLFIALRPFHSQQIIRVLFVAGDAAKCSADFSWPNHDDRVKFDFTTQFRRVEKVKVKICVSRNRIESIWRRFVRKLVCRANTSRRQNAPIDSL